MLGLNLALGVASPGQRSLLQRALSAIRRCGGTLIGIPDNFAGAYIDSTGTQPVTAVGDLLGRINDQIGTNNATQPTTASKPIVAVNAQGKKVISFDGSNDFLQTGITTGNEGWICAGFKQNSAVTVYPVASGGLTDTQAGICLRLTSGITPLVMASDGTLRQLVVADSNIAIGEAVVQSCGWNSTTLMLGVNNTEKSEARTRNPTSSTITTIGGADGTGSGTVNGQITAVVRCPVLPSAADRALIRKWIGSLQGQTL